MRADNVWANIEANALFERADTYYHRQQYAQALVDYRRYIDLYPDLYRANDAIFRSAQCLEAMGERMDAANVYRALALVYTRSALAPAAFLRAGELRELEGWLTDAEWDYGMAASRYPHTEPGQIALERQKAVKQRISAARVAAAETAGRRRRGWLGPGTDSDVPHPPAPRQQWPPPGKTLEDVLKGR